MSKGREGVRTVWRRGYVEVVDGLVQLFEFVVAEVGGVGLVVDEIFEGDLVVDYSLLHDVGWYSENVDFVGTTEVEISE